MSDDAVIRPATADDLRATVTIEEAADALLVELFGAVDWPPPASTEDRLHSPGFVLVAVMEGVPVGFVQVIETDGHAHLEQLSVLPAHGRRGHGRRLVHAALDEASRRGHGRITLRTYSDVAWNAPFYATCGFRRTEPDTDFLRSLVQVERALNLFDYGPREQMTALLPR